MKSLICILSALLPAFALDNGIRVLNPTGSTQTDIPYSIGRMFAAGEFSAATPCAKPYVNGLAATRWQCQVVSTWPQDGSTKFALLDWINPSLGVAPSGDVVEFRPTALTSEGGAGLTKAAVLAASWDADMQFKYNSGTANEYIETRDLRTIFNALTENESCTIGTETSAIRKLRRRREGPVLTEWIVEDLCATVAYDFGRQWNGASWGDGGPAYHSIHPYFVLTAYKDYPSSGNITVKVRFVVENPWTRKRQDQVYRQRFRAGDPIAVVEEQTIDYTHTYRSTYSFEAWATSQACRRSSTIPTCPI